MTKQAPVPVDAFLIGAPKCGTTWLADVLASHEDVCVSNPKEVNELSNHRGTFARLPKNPDWERFENSFQHDGFRIDASIHAFADPDAPIKWATWYPRALFLLCVRDPAHRAVSHWNMIRNGELERKYDVSWKNFEKAWKDSRLHSESLFGRSMSRWLRYFQLSQFLIIDSYHMKKRPDTTFAEVLNFLKLKSVPIDTAKRQSRHVTEQIRPLTRTGKAVRCFARSKLGEQIRSSKSALKISELMMYWLTKRSTVVKCQDYHRFVCSAQVLPDLELFERITGFDASQWIREISDGAARYESTKLKGSSRI